MRALFVDFDGVLHPASASSNMTPDRLANARSASPTLFCYASRLAMLLGQHRDVRVVVHSSWRNALSEVELLGLLPELARWFGGAVEPPFRGRDECIREWTRRHAPSSFRVLDDEPRLFSGTWPELIYCDPELGLSDERAATALRTWLEARE